MSYKKDLEGFVKKGVITTEEAIAFAIGKGHFRLPNATDMTALCNIMSSADVDQEEDDDIIDVSEMTMKEQKGLMANLIFELGTDKKTSRKKLQAVWNIARNRRKRALMIAAITAGSVIVVGGITFGILTLINKNKEMQDTSNVNDDTSDIEVYTEDIPQVDINSDTDI